MTQTKTIFGTGHRPRNGIYDHFHPVNEQIRFHTNMFLTQAVAEAGFEDVMWGGALGFDQRLAEAAITLRETVPIKIIAALPFKGFGDHWPKASRRHLDELVDRSDMVVYVCPPGYKPYKFIERDHYMVDHSQGGICMWDGTLHGGTYQTVKYARSKQIPLLNILAVNIDEALGLKSKENEILGPSTDDPKE